MQIANKAELVQMNIAVVIPVGSLTSMGYQYHWRLALESFSTAAKKVYILPTTRSSCNLDDLPGNVEIVVDEKCLFEQNGEGNEVFDIWKIYAALKVGAQAARIDGFEYCLIASINMLLDQANAEKLGVYAERLAKLEAPFGWTKRAFIVGDNLLKPNAIVPNLYRCDFIDSITWEIDAIRIAGLKAKLTKFRGFALPECAIIYDIVGTETEADFNEKFAWYEKGYRKQLGLSTKRKTFEEHIKRMLSSVLQDVELDDSTQSELAFRAKALYSTESVGRKLDISMVHKRKAGYVFCALKYFQVRYLLLLPFTIGILNNFRKEFKIPTSVSR